MLKVRLNLRNVVKMTVACLAVTMMFTGCDQEKDEPVDVGTEQEANIVAFSFAGIDGKADINNTTCTVTVKAKETVDLTALVAEFTLSKNASAKVGNIVQESKKTVNNFSFPVTYKVISGDGETENNWTVTITGGKPSEGDDVYVLGEEGGISKLWKNGVVQEFDFSVYSIFASGNDVYLVGNKNSEAILWENGEEQILPRPTNNQDFDKIRIVSAVSIYVSNGDVYVAGNSKSDNGIQISAVVWKNGTVLYAFKTSTGYDSYKSISVFASGDDVYLLGYEQNRPGSSYVTTYRLWKNNQKEYSFGSESIFSIFVSGMYWYAVGYQNKGNSSYPNRYATVWKNGVMQDINRMSNGTTSADVWSIYVSGGDTYVAGYEASSSSGDKAVIWKNGEKQNLSDGTMNEYTTSIYVTSIGNVYVAGYEKSSSHSAAKIWINGKEQMLTDGSKSARANSIFVAEKKK